MRKAIVWWCAACLLGACASELSASLDGKQCSTAGQCSSGFICEASSNLCVRTEQLGVVLDGVGSSAANDGGAGGALGSGGDRGLPLGGLQGGAAGTGSAPGGLGGVSGLSHDAGAASDAAISDGGAGAAANDGSDASCQKQTLYQDRDGDGEGQTSQAEQLCPQPGWVSQPGDCRDDQPLVFTGQERYFAVPYPDPLRPQGVSFDFDCDGAETPDPSNQTLDAAPTCGGLGLLVCTGSGFLPATPARSGTSVDARCGSNMLRSCVVVNGIGCASQDVAVADDVRFRCR
jgi:hypothetical protein